MLDVLTALVLVGMGYFLGRRERRAPAVRPRVEEQERVRLQEDRAAFAQLMGYNADRAYGLEEE